MSEASKPTLRPVDADGVLVGYELEREGIRIGFVHLEDVLGAADPSAFMHGWVEGLVNSEGSA